LASWYAVPIAIDLRAFYKLIIVFHLDESRLIKEDVIYPVGFAWSDCPGGGRDNEVPRAVQFSKFVQGSVFAHS
jgi:hypothetical protein